MVMTWDKFTGTIRRSGVEATCEMMDLPYPNWMCRFFYIGAKEVELEVKQFEEGELEQAHGWCVKKITDYESRKGINRGDSES
jgi:hypothetical protein